MPHLALVVNPDSGSGWSRADVEAALRRHGAEVTGFGIEQAEEAAMSSAERVVVASGDGSIGVVAACAARAQKPLAVVPAGTANDFARAMRIPLDLGEACSGAFGGGAEIAKADPSDGLLDVTVVEAGPRRELIRRGAAMRAGRLLSQDGVRHARGRSVEIEGLTRFNVDGELHAAGPAGIRVQPGALELVAPVC